MLSRCLVKPRNSCILWGRRKTRRLRRVCEPARPKAPGSDRRRDPRCEAGGSGHPARRGGGGDPGGPRPLRSGMEPLPAGHRLPAPAPGQRGMLRGRGGSAQERTPARRVPARGARGAPLSSRPGRAGWPVESCTSIPLPAPLRAPRRGHSRTGATPYGNARVCARTYTSIVVSCTLQISM